MQPRFYVEIDGVPIAGGVAERLLSANVIDRDGDKADGFDIEFNAGDAFGADVAVPRKDAIATVAMGYGDSFFGRSGTRDLIKGKVDARSLKFIPFKISVSGSSADLHKGRLKEPKERHWDKKKLADIFGEIASDAGLELKISSKIGQHLYEWLGQLGESDIQFGRRLAARHNALFTIKDGKLIVAERGSGESASGGSMGVSFITPEMIIVDSGTLDLADRSKYSKVVATYHDKDKAKRIEVEASSGADSDSVFRLRQTFADAGEAGKAADAKSKQLKRGDETTSVTIIGDNSWRAGQPFKYRVDHPDADRPTFIATEVKHSYTKANGYRCEIQGKVHDGQSGSGDFSKKRK